MKCKICGEELTHMEGNYYFAHKHNEINPKYRRLAQIAYDTVLQTMIEGEKEHGADGWKELSIYEHGIHATQHIMDHSMGYTAEDHIAHCLTRLAMARYLEAEQAGKGKGNEISQETGSY